MKVAIFLTTIFNLLLNSSSPDYRAEYNLTYSPDSTRTHLTRNESFFLYIAKGARSFYASENYLKKDSIRVLIKSGVLSEYDVMDSKNRFTTRFDQFIQKEYATKSNKAYETIGFLHYVYPIQSSLEWKIGTEQDSLSGYSCVRATTQFAGRDYEAWFTPEIPIPDGPYVFSGLPGLIIKVNDLKNHYVFTLTQFEEYTGKITEAPTFYKSQPITIDQSKAFALREDLRKDPMGAIKRTTGIDLGNATVQAHGSTEVRPAKSAMKDRSWDNNPLELKE